MENDCLICFVLDKSGSMMPVQQATCEGYNTFMTSQREGPGKTLVSLTLFDTSFNQRYTPVDITNIPALGLMTNPYQPGGNTALFDAVAHCIKVAERWVTAEHWENQVKVVILTDGQENSSRSWHVRHPREEGDKFDVAGLIDWKIQEGWDFIFLGAGGTEWLEKTFDTLPGDTFFAYAGDSMSTHSTYDRLSHSMTQSRAGGQSIGSSMQENDQ